LAKNICYINGQAPIGHDKCHMAFQLDDAGAVDVEIISLFAICPASSMVTSENLDPL